MRRFEVIFGAYFAAVLVAAIPISVDIAYNGTVYLNFSESILGVLSMMAVAVTLLTVIPSVVAIYITEAMRVRNPFAYAIFGAGLAMSLVYLGNMAPYEGIGLLMTASGSAAGLTYWWVAWRWKPPTHSANSSTRVGAIADREEPEETESRT